MMTWGLGDISGMIIDWSYALALLSSVVMDLNMWDNPGENFWLFIISTVIGHNKSK